MHLFATPRASPFVASDQNEMGSSSCPFHVVYVAAAAQALSDISTDEWRPQPGLSHLSPRFAGVNALLPRIPRVSGKCGRRRVGVPVREGWQEGRHVRGRLLLQGSLRCMGEKHESMKVKGLVCGSRYAI